MENSFWATAVLMSSSDFKMLLERYSEDEHVGTGMHAHCLSCLLVLVNNAVVYSNVICMLMTSPFQDVCIYLVIVGKD